MITSKTLREYARCSREMHLDNPAGAFDAAADALDDLSKQLQEEKMVTFKLSQQIEKKDAALREALEYSGGELPDLVVEQIKEALK